MEFNPNKTVNVNFTRSDKSHPDISFGHTINYIDCKQNHCHLGLTLQSNACWSEHITNIFDKACQRLNVLRTLKYKLNRESLIKIYISFIRPILEYGDVVWDNCTQEQSNLLESVQIEAGRIITGLRRTSSRQNLYNELGWETLSDRRKKHKVTLMYKILNNYTPKYLYDMVEQCLPVSHNYSLRNNNLFHIPITRTVAYYNSFLPSTVKLWNTLPNSLKSATSIAKFKQGVQNNNPVDKIKSKLYNHGQRNLNILHCQLRNISSNLNADLYNHNLVESSKCLRCGYSYEDSFHFFFHCQFYNSQRNSLFRYMSDHDIPIDINILLHGYDCLSLTENISFFDQVHQFIKNSKRF